MDLTIWQAVILGVIEGITEYLPISSTGHLIITSALLGLDHPPERKEAVDTFNIVIQGGAILAVLGLYRARVLQMIKGLLGRDAIGRRLFVNICIAFLPAAVIGVFADDWIERQLFHPRPVIAALALGGVLLLLIGPWQKRRFDHAEEASPDDKARYVDIMDLTWKKALFIGLLQCVAMWPGTSRSMMTIVGGMFVGMRPKQAAEFSFLLGLPTLGGACVYKLAKSYLGDGPNMSEQLGVGATLIGLAVATVSAAVAIKWLVTFLTRHGLAVFGWYRIALSIVLVLMMWTGAVTIGV